MSVPHVVLVCLLALAAPVRAGTPEETVREDGRRAVGLLASDAPAGLQWEIEDDLAVDCVAVPTLHVTPPMRAPSTSPRASSARRAAADRRPRSWSKVQPGTELQSAL